VVPISTDGYSNRRGGHFNRDSPQHPLESKCARHHMLEPEPVHFGRSILQFLFQYDACLDVPPHDL
jgi:hypothetical protein